MKQILYILPIILLMTSCATLMNQQHKNITIYTTEPSRIIYNQDTIRTSDNKAYLSVVRKKETLSIVVNTDSCTKSFDVQPRTRLTMYHSNYRPTLCPSCGHRLGDVAWTECNGYTVLLFHSCSQRISKRIYGG